ncbi:MAG: lipoyl synthase [Coriobacteriia bacterium]|nr:lipoyl synthase [Coriobacteriia bacterium]
MSLTEAYAQGHNDRSTLRKPDWLRVPRRSSPEQSEVEGLLKELGLNTVCKEANCPNYSDCFSRKTATFMIMGTDCTRNCRFCNVKTSKPQGLDADEPLNVAQAVQRLGLRYVVITAVTRDDLPDGGASHFAATIRAVRRKSPQTAIEVLVPDFKGNKEAILAVVQAGPDVISHNIETVPALYSRVRSQANYRRSLGLLAEVKRLDSSIKTKSGIMLGLGEVRKQVLEVFDDLMEASCEILTVGQYLSPSLDHYPVQEFIEPEIFDNYRKIAYEKGFGFVASAPLVRSSYQAEEALHR